LDLNPEKLKNFYQAQFKKGQDIAKKMKEKQDEGFDLKEDLNQEESNEVRDVVDKLNDLAKLHKEGIITKTELEKAKKRLLK